MATADAPWPGCCGARLDPPDLAEGLGSSRGDPLLDVALRAGRLGPPASDEIWRRTGRLTIRGRDVDFEQRLTRSEDGSLLVHVNGGALGVDPVDRVLTIDGAAGPGVVEQLVTVFGLPLLLYQSPVLLLHACAAIPPGRRRAHVVCAASGTGKSTLLVALVAAGWQAVSEDLCAIDLRGPEVVVWPGPPWVRVAGDGPPGASRRFPAGDKDAWDLAPWQVDQPVEVDHVVAMEPSGGADMVWRPVETPESIRHVARFVQWIDDIRDRPRTVFGPTVRVASRLPVMQLRLPRSADWASRAESILRGAGTASA